MDLDSFLQLIVVGFASGLGLSLGNYIANEHLLKQLERLKKTA